MLYADILFDLLNQARVCLREKLNLCLFCF